MLISPGIYFKVELVDAENPLPQPFITAENMGFFQIVETSGASLPFVVFSFFTTDSKMEGFFSPINKIRVTVGDSESNCDSFTFRPLKNPKTSERSERGWEIVVGGFIGDSSYMTSKSNELYVGNSLEVIKKIMKESSLEDLDKEVDTNIEEGQIKEDPTRWIRPNQTLAAFVMDTVLHMNISPSFPLICIDKFGKMHVNDCMKQLKNKSKITFTPFEPSSIYEIQYLNNFNIENHRLLYGFYSGYSKVTQIQNVSSGEIKYEISDDVPLIASTKMTETFKIGPRNKTNKLQSDNVHDYYQEIFQYNTSKLMSLSAQLGAVKLVGYHRGLKATDLVDVKLPKSTSGELSAHEGFYIIDSIQTTFDFRHGQPRMIFTNIYVTRDNPNNVEDFDVTPKRQKKSLMKLGKGAVQELCNAIAECRTALIMGSRIMDGTFIKYCLNFLIETKTNLLRSFSIGGTRVDFNSQALFLQSMLCVSNTIMNAFTVNMILPDFIATTLRDFLIEKPSMSRLLSKYITQYVPSELQSIVTAIAESLLKTHSALNSIAKANGISARKVSEVVTIGPNEAIEEPRDIIGEIIREFEVHTRGVDLPFPVITLTESQDLWSKDKIKDYVADETIDNLKELGYLDGINEDEFKEVLVSDDPKETLSFATISKINENAGNMFMYRFWGTYGPTNEALYAWTFDDNTIYTKVPTLSKNTRMYTSDYSPYMGKDFKVEEINGNFEITYRSGVTTRDLEKDVNTTALAQLTSYYISKGFKDRYRTIPCTKVISATQNSRLYFVCPQTERNIKFYINSKRVTLNSFPIDMGYRDNYGNKILYDVYYTTTGYNSNHTTLEVRQG